MTRCVASLCLLVAVTTLSRFCVHGFVVPSTFSVPSVGSRSNHVCMSCPAESNEPKLGGSSNVATFSTRKPSPSIVNPIGAVCTSSVFWIATSQMAMADSPDWGIFEGRTGSLLHPITMGSLFVFSLYTAYLGFQWRRQRTLGDEISDLRKTLPNLEGAPSVSAALSAAKDANDLYKINALTAALAIEDKIVSLTAERKSLAEAGLRDKHFQQGAMLAFIGTCFAIEGPLNTFARAGKLFPGPHLYAGAGLVCLWALAAACVPAMQKGNDSARLVHIGANVVGIGMFAWQVVSGLPILFKVIEKTSWP